MSSAPLPRHVGPYKPLRKLGEGGMGVVWCAQDQRPPGRLVALKVVSAGSIGSGDDSARRFIRESRILESLRHPNIVSFYEVGVHQGQSWFAMELLTGQPISAFAARPWPALLPLFVQVCDGMEYLAERSIVHRDLSPDNIFVVQEGGGPRAKILDFGIAKDTTAQETIHNFTRTGLLMGKPPYWSPEQIGLLHEGETLDWRSDLYTLGVIFYRLLSGALPFQADSPIGFISLHLNEPAPPLEAPEGNPPIPEPVAQVVLGMMAKHRDERPQSYREIGDVLRSALREAGVEMPIEPAVADGDSPTAATVVPPTRETRRWEEADEPTLATGPMTAGVTRGVVTRETRALTGLDEHEPTIALTSERAGAPREAAAPEAPRRGGRGLLFAALGAAALVLAVGGTLVLRPAGAPEAAAGPTVVPSEAGAAGPTGTLALTALPWGTVRSVVHDETGEPLPIARGLTTPLRLELPPGRYRVEIGSGVGPEVRRLVVEVRAGRTQVETVQFVTGSEAVRLLE